MRPYPPGRNIQSVDWRSRSHRVFPARRTVRAPGQRRPVPAGPARAAPVRPPGAAEPGRAGTATHRRDAPRRIIGNHIEDEG
ncbi:hypothetical protein GCM10027160_47060 [Streptomyces calidiresistens]